MPGAAAVRRRVRVEMRSEGVKAVGGAGSPGGERVDAAGSVIAAESARCEGARWVTALAAAGASAEPVPPLEGTAQTEAKTVSAAGKKYPRPGRRSTVVTVEDTQATRSPKKIREVVNPHTWFVRAKIAKIRRGERETTQNSDLGAEHQPTQANIGGRRRTYAKPAGPDEEDTAIFHAGEAARSTAVVFRGMIWRTGQEMLAVFEGIVERGEKLGPPLDSLIAVSYFADAFERLVIRKYAKQNVGPQR